MFLFLFQIYRYQNFIRAEYIVLLWGYQIYPSIVCLELQNWSWILHLIDVLYNVEKIIQKVLKCSKNNMISIFIECICTCFLLLKMDVKSNLDFKHFICEPQNHHWNSTSQQYQYHKLWWIFNGSTYQFSNFRILVKVINHQYWL